MPVPEQRPLTVHDLFLYMRQFKEDNRHSRNLENRWLASFIEPIIETARQLYAGDKSEIVDAALKEFRQKELEAEIAGKTAEIQDLECELKQLK